MNLARASFLLIKGGNIWTDVDECRFIAVAYIVYHFLQKLVGATLLVVEIGARLIFLSLDDHHQRQPNQYQCVVYSIHDEAKVLLGASKSEIECKLFNELYCNDVKGAAQGHHRRVMASQASLVWGTPSVR